MCVYFFICTHTYLRIHGHALALFDLCYMHSHSVTMPYCIPPMSTNAPVIHNKMRTTNLATYSEYVAIRTYVCIHVCVHI